MMVKGVAYVSNLEADVVDAARGLGLEEVGDGRVLTERVEELELGVAQLYEHRRHAMLSQRLMSERVCEERESGQLGEGAHCTNDGGGRRTSGSLTLAPITSR
jgi:hypothetical protein